MKYLWLLLFISANLFAQKNMYKTPYEKGNGNQTATYQETIDYFALLDVSFGSVKMMEMGLTDSGEPLRIVIYNPDGNFNFEQIHNTKAVLLINNGIHPGEPDGIDATMMLYRDLATGKIAAPKNTVIVTIPVYNIGGMLNRNSHTRANQNGPESYGFRGNARNYDLNRDFVKCDTRNARSFAQIFHTVQPDVFIDNHVSNGADYQYTLTYIETHHQKLGYTLGNFFKNEMMPEILAALQKKNIEATPYVNVHDKKPDGGFEQFMDHPRYSTGYASLFNVPGSMPETHMLKEYSARVNVTYEYMLESLLYTDRNATKIKSLRKENRKQFAPTKSYTLQWQPDREKVTQFAFLGYEGGYKKSDVTGADRLYYDRSKPFKKDVPYHTEYIPTVKVTIPGEYIIPQQWWEVIELLKLNGIQMHQLIQDGELKVQSYRIKSYSTSPYPYEGHYPHSNVELEKSYGMVQFRKGDYIVSTSQPGVKYLLEMLEPQGADSFFAWNFFDAILQQKEYFSPYVFEDTAAQLLKENTSLRETFEKKKHDDAGFAGDPEAQLDWIYRQSDYYEKSHMQYPVYRKPAML